MIATTLIANRLAAVLLGTAGQTFWAVPGVFTGVTVAVVIAIRNAMRTNRRRARPKRPPRLPVVAVHPAIPPQLPLRPPLGQSSRGVAPIQLVRDLLGEPPRTFDPSLAHYLQVEPPQWLTATTSDELYGVYPAQDRLRAYGRVVWAAVVQANALLFKPGPEDHPASVIWSEDRYFDARPKALLAITPELYSLKGNDQVDAESAAFARMLTNERIRAPRLKVPSRFTGGRVVYHSSLMFTRKHLPKGYVTGNLMPVWIDPAPSGMVLMVPAAYWPPSVTAAWGDTNGA